MKWWVWLLIGIVALFVVEQILSGPPPWRGSKPGEIVNWQGRIYRWRQLDFGSLWGWEQVGGVAI